MTRTPLRRTLVALACSSFLASPLLAHAEAVQYVYQVIFETPKPPAAPGPATGKAVLELSPKSHTFGPVQTGSTSPVRIVSVRNVGTKSLKVQGIGLASGAGDFAQTNNCATVPANGSCSISVAFTPSATGARAGTLALVHDGEGDAMVSLAGEGRGPQAAVDSVSFAQTKVGTTSTATAVLHNTGTGPLSVQAPSAASVSGGEFAFESTDCGPSLVPGATCQTVVRFTPAASGQRAGALVLATGAGPQSAALSGTGLQAVASFSPSSLEFAAQQVDSSSAPRAISVTNTGTAELAVSGIGLVQGGSHFAQSNNCTTLAVGASCTVQVSFTPSTAGGLEGVLALTHDGAGLSTVALTGAGRDAAATLTPPTFTPTAVGSTSTAVATLKNTGSGALTVSPVTLASVEGDGYRFESTTCASFLAPDASCLVTIRFSPSSVEPAAGRLTLATGAGEKQVSLGSTAIQGYVSVSPAQLDFAISQVSVSSAGQVVKVTNTGSATLAFTGIGVASGASDFAQTHDCGSVPVNGACSINVSFTPSAAGLRKGTLALTHDGGGSALVDLTGSGQAPAAQLTTPDFPATQVGQVSTATAVLTNTGLASISVQAPTAESVTGAAYTLASSTCPGSLAASASCAVTVRFAPTDVESAAGTLTLVTGAGKQSTSWASAARAPSVSLEGPQSYSFNVPNNTGSGHWAGVRNNGVGPVTVHRLSYVSTQGAFAAWMNESGDAGWYCHPGKVLEPGAACGMWTQGDGVNGSVSIGTATLHTSGGDASFTGTFTVRGLNYGSTTGATVLATGGTTAPIYGLTISNPTPFNYFFPMHSRNGGIAHIGRFLDGDADRFAVVGTNCPGTLAPNTSCTVSIAAKNVATPGTYRTSFQPNGTYQQVSDGNIGYWDPAGWLANMGWSTVDVYASPLTPVDVTVQSAKLVLTYPNHPPYESWIVWGNIPVGSTGGSALFTLANTGSATATDLAVHVPFGWTRVNNTCGATLAAGSSCTFNIYFTPTEARQYNAPLSASTSAGPTDTPYVLKGSAYNP